MINSKSNLDILLALDRHVFGHTEAKKALISLVNRSKVRYYLKWMRSLNEPELMQTQKILLIGQSGTGKTHLVQALSKVVDFPLIFVDATKFNPVGASGGITEIDLRKLIVKKAREVCEKFPHIYFSVEGAVDQTVVFVDEIDKLGESFDSSGNWNAHVQSNFLTMFDNKAELAGVSFIFAGAFSGITGETDSKKNNSIGFASISKEKDALDKNDMDDRIIKAGLIPELVGRLTNIVQLEKFTTEDYAKILKNVLIPQKELELSYYGLDDIQLTEDQITSMIETAKASGQGVRSLIRALNKHLAEFEFHYEDLRYLENF